MCGKRKQILLAGSQYQLIPVVIIMQLPHVGTILNVFRFFYSALTGPLQESGHPQLGN